MSAVERQIFLRATAKNARLRLPLLSSSFDSKAPFFLQRSPSTLLQQNQVEFKRRCKSSSDIGAPVVLSTTGDDNMPTTTGELSSFYDVSRLVQNVQVEGCSNAHLEGRFLRLCLHSPMKILIAGRHLFRSMSKQDFEALLACMPD